MPAAPRFFCPAPLVTGATVELPEGAARHVQVLRLQPGDTITLFGGRVAAKQSGAAVAPSDSRPGGEFDATICAIGRRDVRVRIDRHHPIEREPVRDIHLAIGVPANERMDWLVEKASELGVASIQPLMTERSVVRLEPERAQKKMAHWSSIAIAACEQCGGNRVPAVFLVRPLPAWTDEGGAGGSRLVLSLRPGIPSLRQWVEDGPTPSGPVTVLSGPEGGLSPAEEGLALQRGFKPVSLGARVLRAETAALVALTLLA